MKPRTVPGFARFNPQSEIARHLARLSPSYAATFSRAEIELHAELAARLGDRNPVEVAAEPIEEGYWRVTIVALRLPGRAVADLRPAVRLRPQHRGRARLHV